MKEHKKVMIFGTFDILHAGHENYIKQARKLGNTVIAVIARDKTVKTIKGHFPENKEKQRLKNLQNTNWVDEVILGHQKDKTKVIRTHKPDIIALGYDQFAFTYNLEKLIIENNLNLSIKRLAPYRPTVYKSSIIKEKKFQKTRIKTSQSTK